MKKLLLATVVSFVSMGVYAESEATHPLDVNKDGLISAEEAKQDKTLSAIFADLDLNQDGFLSKEELTGKTEDKSH